MFLEGSVVLVLILLYNIWYNKKFGERDVAFENFPTPKKQFLLHNLLAFFDESRYDILPKFKKWHKELGNVFLITFHPFDCGCVIVADHNVAEVISNHQTNRNQSRTYTPLNRWIGDNGYLMTGGNQWKVLMKPVTASLYYPKNIERVS
jgi:hypothetical protein